MTDETETTSEYSDIEHLGELHPDFFDGLMYHEETEVVIRHCGEEVFTLEDPSGLEIVRPMMRQKGSRNHLQFKVKAFSQALESEDRDDEDGDTVEDGDDENDDNTNANGYDTAGKITFTLEDN